MNRPGALAYSSLDFRAVETVHRNGMENTIEPLISKRYVAIRLIDVLLRNGPTVWKAPFGQV